MIEFYRWPNCTPNIWLHGTNILGIFIEKADFPRVIRIVIQFPRGNFWWKAKLGVLLPSAWRCSSLRVEKCWEWLLSWIYWLVWCLPKKMPVMNETIHRILTTVSMSHGFRALWFIDLVFQSRAKMRKVIWRKEKERNRRLERNRRKEIEG